MRTDEVCGSAGNSGQASAREPRRVPPVPTACLWQVPTGKVPGPWHEEAKCRHVLQNGSQEGSARFGRTSALRPRVRPCLALWLPGLGRAGRTARCVRSHHTGAPHQGQASVCVLCVLLLRSVYPPAKAVGTRAGSLSRGLALTVCSPSVTDYVGHVTPTPTPGFSPVTQGCV